MFTRLLSNLKILQSHPKAAMSIFMHKSNPVTGKMEWEECSEDYDYHQEIARSSYADMLHDTERNMKYQAALEAAIVQMHQKGKAAHVLDIGTGTGLLSMMAARAGADSIVACEAFEPMALCAKEIVKQNGFENKIKIIPKRSTELTVGESGDLCHKANILVTEVFDTELIGEGAYATFSHAHQVLLEKDCIVVPASATVYAQIIDSDLVSQWNTLHPVHVLGGPLLVDTPPQILSCAGAAAVHDIQLSQISPEHFNTVVPPEAVFRFDWSGQAPLIKERSTVQVLKSLVNGVACAVFMWWDLVMDTEGKIILSCAPFWAHPTKPQSAAEIPWRDHWMQAIYYLPRPVHVKKGQELTLISSHDEYSLWFNLGLDLKVTQQDYQRPICSCGAHVAWSRSRIGQMNDTHRNSKYLQALKPLITESTVCLSISDSSLIALAAAKMGCKKVYCLESNILSKKTLQDYVLHNKLQDQVVILDEPSDKETILNNISEKIDLVLSEPHHSSAILPWENIYFWYQKSKVAPLLESRCITIPRRSKLYGMAVEFNDLWKIRARLGNVQGFSMKPFDDLIETSSHLVDGDWEAQPLWEYPCRALSKPVELLEFNFDAPLPEGTIESCGVLDIEWKGKCNGVALWMDWDLNGNTDNVVSSGPSVAPKVGHYVCWDSFTRQGVYFLNEKCLDVSPLHFVVTFQPKSGSIKFKFQTQESSPTTLDAPSA